jgi:acyl-CoA reductase-like NAD-dependent aldehyde dehydrogenase
MTADDAQRRLARAHEAQVLWGQTPPEQRARALRPLRRAIAGRIDEIVAVISDEVGKPAMDALAGDVMVTLEQLGFYERHAEHILRSQKRGKPWFFFTGTRFKEFMEPHGVVLVFAPWNYPLQLTVVPMATALYAGNAVLLKCSEHTPRTARVIEELCVAAGLPEGLVQVSCETPDEAAALLDARPDFVFFTGSSRNGREVASKAASLMVPAVMELGGKDAALVFCSCDLERTANGLAYGSFSNAGQVCIGAKRIYAQQQVYDEFLRIFVERIGRLRVGTSIESDLGLLKFDTVRRRLDEQVADAVARGAKLHSAWRSGETETSPVVLTGVPQDARLLLEESFGPVVCVAPFHSEEDAIGMANASEFALAASVWTGDKAQGERVASRLHCGSCAVNDVIRSIANPNAAFGGNRSSGYGRYHGVEGLRTFSRIKTVMTAFSLRRTEIHWFPFQSRTFARVRALLKLRHGSGFAARIRALRGLWVLAVLLGCAPCFASSTASIATAASTAKNAAAPIAPVRRCQP